MNPANKKYHLTPERQSFLEQYYHQVDNTEILKHALFRDITRGCLHRWAGDLGLTRPAKERPWTPQEETYLAANSHKSLSYLAKYLQRSRFDIARKMRVKTLRKLSNGLTLTDVAMGFGCDKRTVERWINAGWLRARRREIERSDAPWLITEQAVKQFVRCHPNEINKHKVDLLWLLDIIMDGLGDLTTARGEYEKEETRQ